MTGKNPATVIGEILLKLNPDLDMKAIKKMENVCDESVNLDGDEQPIIPQYCRVKFNKYDRREYTYINNLPEKAVAGDQIEVTTPNGIRTPTVISTTEQMPNFKCVDVRRVIPQTKTDQIPE